MAIISFIPILQNDFGPALAAPHMYEGQITKHQNLLNREC